MNGTNLHSNEIELQCREFRHLAHYKPGTKIICEEGILWLTLTGDQKDYILRAGEEFTKRRRGSVLIEAMRDAVFSIN